MKRPTSVSESVEHPSPEARAGAVVIHYRSAATVVRTVKDLAGHFPSERLIVIDNSGELTPEQFEGRARLISPARNLGYAAAANVGVRALLADEGVDAVLVATHETRFLAHSLDRLLATARSFSPGFILAPVLEHETASGSTAVWSAGGRMTTLLRYPAHLRRARRGLKRVMWVDGAAFLLDRRAWDSAGPIPEEFFLYMEDVALGYKAKRAEVPVYVLGPARVGQAATGPSRQLAVRNRLLLARTYMNRVERLIVFVDFWARTSIFVICRDARYLENLQALKDSRLRHVEDER